MSAVDLKKEFIQYLLDTSLSAEEAARAKRCLMKVRGFEDGVGKDVSELTADETESLFRSLPESSRFTILTYIRKYTSWCIRNGRSASDGAVLLYRPSGLDETRSDMVANPTGLQSVLDSVYSPESSMTLSVVYRCFAWCAFSGVPIEDTVCLTSESIDFGERLIRHGSHTYRLYAESVPAFKVACGNTWFRSEHPNHGGAKRERRGGSFLLRGFTADLSYQKITERFVFDLKKARLDGRTNSTVRYATIEKSGIFCRINETETDSSPACFTDEILGRIDRRYSKLGHGYMLYGEDVTNTIGIARAEREMYEDYCRWKFAFLPQATPPAARKTRRTNRE